VTIAIAATNRVFFCIGPLIVSWFYFSRILFGTNAARHLDTDIGTDVDDLLALVFLAHARERLRVRVSYEKTEDHFLFIDKCELQKNRALSERSAR
jgi:hypothetical protein